MYFRSSLNIIVIGIAHVPSEGQLIFVHFVEECRGDTSPGSVGELLTMNPCSSSSNRGILRFVLTRSTDHFYLVFRMGESLGPYHLQGLSYSLLLHLKNLIMTQKYVYHIMFTLKRRNIHHMEPNFQQRHLCPKFPYN